MSSLKWIENFITFDNDEYIAWDETEAGELGRFKTKDEAIYNILRYAIISEIKDTMTCKTCGNKDSIKCRINWFYNDNDGCWRWVKKGD